MNCIKFFSGTITGLAFCSAFNAHGQVFTSGFEDWANELPVQWLGDQNTISPDNVMQVTGDAHSGSYAVRLVHPVNGFTYFTSEPFHLDSGNYYQIGFWAKGAGVVAPALFDDNPWGGILTNPTIQVNSETWEYHIGEHFCQHTTDIAEVMFAIAITYAPDHLMIDDVTLILNNPPPPPYLSIQEIQTPVGAGQESPYDGMVVSTSGIVTAIHTTGETFFVQNGTGPYSGLRVDVPNGAPVEVGDSVRVTGTVYETVNETRLYAPMGTEVIAPNRPLPPPELLLLPLGNLEQWEGVLVTVESLTCASTNAQGWDGTVGASQDVDVRSFFFSTTADVGHTYNVIGIQRSLGVSSVRIDPRVLEDVTEVVGIEETDNAMMRCFPNPANEVVHLQLPDGSQRPSQFALIDATGKIAVSGLTESGLIDLTAVREGMFVLRTLGYVAKIVIRR